MVCTGVDYNLKTGSGFNGESPTSKMFFNNGKYEL